MNNGKKNLVPILCAIGSLAWLIAAVAGPVLRGEPVNYTYLTIAIVFFVFAVLFFAVGRKSGGSPALPSK